MIRPYIYFTQFMYRLREDRGASLVEYALLLALIAVIAIGAIALLGTNVRDEINEVATTIGGP